MWLLSLIGNPASSKKRSECSVVVSVVQEHLQAPSTKFAISLTRLSKPSDRALHDLETRLRVQLGPHDMQSHGFPSRAELPRGMHERKGGVIIVHDDKNYHSMSSHWSGLTETRLRDGPTTYHLIFPTEHLHQRD